jgi:excisionase family DNA binding protein
MREETKALTLCEACKVLNMSPRTAKTMIASGKLRAAKLRRQYRIAESAITEFLRGESAEDKRAA